MKISQLRLVFSALMFGCLTACGGGGSGGSPDPGSVDNVGGQNGGGTVDSPVVTDLNVLTAAELAGYRDFLSDFDQVRVAATDGSPEEFAAQPATGIVTYAGYMQLIMGNTTVSANVVGDTSLQVNLASETVTGSADGFIGVARDEFGTNRAAHYDGMITIANGVVVDNAAGTDTLGFGIDGTLDNGLNRFDISGNLVGTLYGSGAEGLHAIGSNTGVHGDMDVTIDGLDTPNEIAIATVSALKQ